MTEPGSSPPSGTVRSWLDRRAADGGVALAPVDGGEALGWTELRGRAMAFAAKLARRGAEPGESVAILHPNGAEGIAALFGAICGGFRATMINLAAGPDAVSYALEHSEARLACVHPDAEDLFRQAGGERLSRLDAPGGPDAQQEGEAHGDWGGTGASPSVSPGDHALLMYTSGTTGRPKGVVHTHASLLAGGWTAATAHRLEPSDRGLCVLPIYHINALCVSVMGALVSGGSLAVCPRFSASSFWDQASRGEATWLSAVPTIYSHLLHGPAEPDRATRKRLRFARSASSALPEETHRAFEKRFGVPIVETMGLTETAAQILSNPLPPGIRKIGSPGVAVGNEIAILGSDLAPVEAGVEGEIAVRGPNVMEGYFKNPDATAAAFANGWFRTGDLGTMDGDGYVRVTGRLKELIVKGGENIAPREIDEALYAHPGVVEAAAFGRPCPSYGERVEAAVRLRESEPEAVAPTAADLIRLCTERVGPFKAPDAIHFLEELPKGPSGKIQRARLADLTPHGTLR